MSFPTSLLVSSTSENSEIIYCAIGTALSFGSLIALEAISPSDW